MLVCEKCQNIKDDKDVPVDLNIKMATDATFTFIGAEYIKSALSALESNGGCQTCKNNLQGVLNKIEAMILGS